MTIPVELSNDEEKVIEAAVAHFAENRDKFDLLVANLTNILQIDKRLKGLIHSIRTRVKDPDHLKKKLARKAIRDKEAGKKPHISRDNLFVEIGDLAGVRLLHLHTDQFKAIVEALRAILEEQQYRVVEGPIANTWDDEYRSFFEGLGVTTASRDSLYTSVHYVIEPNSRTQMRCEIQVRTLMEEVWGEVSHTINYPEKTASVACDEQLKVLARLTSGCTRLVDSLFRSQAEFNQRSTKGRRPRKS